MTVKGIFKWSQAFLISDLFFPFFILKEIAVIKIIMEKYFLYKKKSENGGYFFSFHFLLL
jgi:hypothetical protein